MTTPPDNFIAWAAVLGVATAGTIIVMATLLGTLTNAPRKEK